MNFLFTSKMIDQTYFWGDEEKHFIRLAINMLHIYNIHTVTQHIEIHLVACMGDD